VIGSRVFATEIHSQVHAESSVDFRARYGLGEVPYAAHELPRRVAEKILAVNADLGLVFGAYDLILTPEDRYVFLEVNQQGQFLWLEEQTGQPLLENFCELLIQARPDYRCSARTHEPGLPALPPLDPITRREIARAEAPPRARPTRQGKTDARLSGGRRGKREREKGKSLETNQNKKGKGKGNRVS
jgi:hypothetical protein